MATVVLGLAGGALGGMLGPFGAVAGRAIGALAGSFVDQMIVNALTPPTKQDGPRLTTADIQASTEGAVIDRVIGRARVSGQVIWATRIQEEVTTETTGGGKGAPTRQPKVTTTTYAYYGNFAIGLCEGPVDRIGRIWADGKEIDQTAFAIRRYGGWDAQAPDPLIEAKEGAAPAYRGLAYLVFERLPLGEYGNRLPQVSAEVYRRVGDLETMIPGVSLIGGNEFGFDTQCVRQTGSEGGPLENRHTLVAETDFAEAMDRLRLLAPFCNSVMLVLPWMGDDLRAGHCTVRPKVDSSDKVTAPEWRVSNLTRSTAMLVSYVGGLPAYGGSPNDESVIRAIQNLHVRGYQVTVCPFVMMDIPSGNVLPDPYSANAATEGQPAYPWRGRITCSPAAGAAGSVDKTPAAAAQVAAFVGAAGIWDFAAAGTTVTYSGPDEWSYRRFILHYAWLATLAGGVESFLVGSEMIGLTQVRSDASTYPFVQALRQLAADCASILGIGATIGYTADWTEYSGHRPADGSGDVYFHLDPLWADANVHFVGIDNYFPLADWRDGTDHLDYDPAGPTTIYDPAYLAANVAGGERFDWYYASQADRDAQIRTSITDGAYNKPWVFRLKDLVGWWGHAHYNRPGGIESGTPTAWVAQGKPFRFVEMGCPAVDKGANQPNVFVDPKSSESFFPHYSSRARDDAMQRAWLEAMIGHFQSPANNPTSGQYGGPMLDLSRSHVWTWDVRPWPSWPQDPAWGDRDNWWQGHWLDARLGAAPAREAIRTILQEAGFQAYAISPIPAVVDGITTGAIASARARLEALRAAFQFDAVESDGVIRFVSRQTLAPVATITADELVAAEGGARFRATRGQETELPAAVKLRYADVARDDQPAGTEARRSTGGSLRTLDLSIPVVTNEDFAGRIAATELHSAWTGRDRLEATLAPSRLAIDPGDVLAFPATGQLVRVSDVNDAAARTIQTFRVEPLAAAPVAGGRSDPPRPAPTIYLPATVAFVDGPLLGDADPDHAGYIGGTLSPWRHGLALWRSPTTSGFQLDTLLSTPAAIGVTTSDLWPGTAARWDVATVLGLRLIHGNLQSADPLLVLNGANPLLVENQDGEWELVQFADANQTGTRSWTLTRLLRGRLGTEHAMRAPVPAGARVLLVDDAVVSTGLPASLIGVTLNWRAGPADEDVGSDDHVASTRTLRGRGRRPLSPVHVRGWRQANGDVTLSWVRRTRIGGDAWDQADVPLGEAAEAYEVDVLDGGLAVARTLAVSSPSATYLAADQATDGLTGPFTVDVCQLSATFGRGVAARKAIDV